VAPNSSPPLIALIVATFSDEPESAHLVGPGTRFRLLRRLCLPENTPSIFYMMRSAHRTPMQPEILTYGSQSDGSSFSLGWATGPNKR
jgi:hypothetical protein